MGKFLYKGNTFGSVVQQGINNAEEISYDNTTTELESTNVQSAIDEVNEKVEECFQSVSNGKNLIASAITDKGVPTMSDASFYRMAENISDIQTGSSDFDFIAEQYDSTKEYKKGDIVDYAGQMYICVAEEGRTTTGNFRYAIADWERTYISKIAGENSNLGENPIIKTICGWDGTNSYASTEYNISECNYKTATISNRTGQFDQLYISINGNAIYKNPSLPLTIPVNDVDQLKIMLFGLPSRNDGNVTIQFK